MEEKNEVQVNWTPDILLEINLDQPDDFLKIKETLTRIGIASMRDKKLYQSCHILHKKGRYYLVHFKELFLLDGKPASFTEGDLARRNTIATLLSDWGLLTIVDGERAYPLAPTRQIKIISHREKTDWVLEQKYTIGNKK